VKKQILFIINPIAGVRRKDRIPRLVDKYLDHVHFDYDVIYTERRGHATQIAADAAARGVDVVAVAGGDGSVNEAASGLIGTNTHLAIIPSGSGNGLARHLGYSINIRSTLQIINAYATQQIDVCRVNNNYFYSLIGVGFDAFVAKVFSREETRGFFTYAWSAIRSIGSFDAFTYDMQLDDVHLSGKALMINVCNSNQYGYNVKVAPTASLQDGMMDIVVLRDIAKWKVPFAVIMVFCRLHPQSGFFTLYRAKSVQIQTPQYTHLQIDGETTTKEKSFKIEIIPAALKVLVHPEKQNQYEKEAERSVRARVQYGS